MATNRMSDESVKSVKGRACAKKNKEEESTAVGIANTDENCGTDARLPNIGYRQRLVLLPISCRYGQAGSPEMQSRNTMERRTVFSSAW